MTVASPLALYGYHLSLSSFVYRLNSLLRLRSFRLVAVLLCFGENFGDVARRHVRYFGIVEAERNLPRIHVRLHAVAIAISNKFLAELFYFRNFVALHDY